jgi:hypothetical protein
MFYTYIALKDCIPIYVGKGSKKRYLHCYRKFVGCNVLIDKHFNTAEEAFIREKELILEYGREDLNSGTLKNRSNGGKYITGAIYWKNKKRPVEMNEKLSKSLKQHYADHPEKIRDVAGNKNPFFGKIHSEETIQKISMTQRGKVSPFKGKKHTSNAIEKNRLAHLGKPSKKKIKFNEAEVINLYKTGISFVSMGMILGCSKGPIMKYIKAKGITR